MDCFIVCNRDRPDICALEVKELIGKESSTDQSICIVKNITANDLATLSFFCQSAYRIAILAGTFKLSKLEETKDHLNKEIMNDFLKDATSFKVEHQKIGEHTLQSPDIQAIIGSNIKEIEPQLSVNLSKPDITIYSFANESSYYVGIDIIGFEMNKRPYKLFAHAGSLSGPFAYTIARLAGIDKKSVIVDPCCGSGTIPIEVSLYQNKVSCFKFERKFLAYTIPKLKDSFEQVEHGEPTSKDQVFGYDHLLKVILNASKNAKLAGVNSVLSFSKVALDWVDAKFEENEVDFIITDPPKINKRTQNAKQILKVYDELFYQARYLIKKDGVIGVLLVKEGTIEEIAQKHKFKLKEKINIHHGEQPFVFLLFKPS